MHCIERLKKEALEAATFNGHKMKKFKTASRTVSRAFSECEVCGKTIYIDTHPPANGIDVSGSAVATGCTPNHMKAGRKLRCSRRRGMPYTSHHNLYIHLVTYTTSR